MKRFPGAFMGLCLSLAAGVVRGQPAGAPSGGSPHADEVAPGDYLIDPPGQEAPAIRTPRLRTQIYADYTFAYTPDLSALSVVKGRARNHRFALGGTLRVRRLEIALEVPLVQSTTAHFDEFAVFGSAMKLDADDTSVAFGDVRAGIAYSRPVAPRLLLGGALRARFSTHTSRFEIPISGSSQTYEFPRYWHVEPTALLAGALGPLSFVTNQGLLAMLGKDIDYMLFQGGATLTQVFPELLFWDAHYALGVYFLGAFGFTIDLNTVIQLNTVENPDPPSPPFAEELNDIAAVYLSPGLQIYLGRTKIDIGGRIGLTDGADRYGVISFSGKHSAMLRVTHAFDRGGAAPVGP